jgi:hypothetical protein
VVWWSFLSKIRKKSGKKIISIINNLKKGKILGVKNAITEKQKESVFNKNRLN